MIRKVLIANRGEIACRIIKTCRDMGLATVAIYSEADKHSLAVEMADEAVFIGANEPRESYLNIEKILEVAKRTHSDAIHPGFGFLAENPQFAYLVSASGLVFIGPSPSSIEAMGDKRIAKILLQDVPFVPSYLGDEQSDTTLQLNADLIGYPVMVKAAAGGGGKGMRLVTTPESLPEALASARREALQAFGNDALLLEKAIEAPRHIEIQIFGDQHGNLISIGERECTIQRRHQKIVEETPSTAIDATLRAKMSETAIHIGKQIGYYSAGTIEFLLDSDGNYYFMEMNTRLQVEHPVTELVYGVDLVRAQIEVARNRTLSEIFGEAPLQPKGHAIEVRVYAEDPENQFLPVIGKIGYFEPSSHVRTDSGIRSGDEVTPYYDPMLAKVIAYDSTRFDSIRKLEYALRHMKLLGLRNNIDYLRRVLLSPEHLAGILSTQFVEEQAHLLTQPTEVPHSALIACAITHQTGNHYWRNNPNRPLRETFRTAEKTVSIAIMPQQNNFFICEVDGIRYEVERLSTDNHTAILIINGHRQPFTLWCDSNQLWWIHTLEGTFTAEWVSPFPSVETAPLAEGSLHAPMTGKVTQVLVQIGQTVAHGELLLIMEAMKMEHRIESPKAGTITALYYQQGDSVQADSVLLEVSDKVS